MSAFADRWGLLGSPNGGPDTALRRRPIPFDGILFARLDRKICFQLDESTGSVIEPAPTISGEIDAELLHEPDHAIPHVTAKKLVLLHHRLRSWEDIPPYQRSRGYNDQPAYTDDYDDFLWLPRDPLSTLDLDDTIEMRLSLTTSSGGSGRIADWPPRSGNSSVERLIPEDEDWQEVSVRQPGRTRRRR